MDPSARYPNILAPRPVVALEKSGPELWLVLSCGHRRRWPSDAKFGTKVGEMRTCVECGLREGGPRLIPFQLERKGTPARRETPIEEPAGPAEIVTNAKFF